MASDADGIADACARLGWEVLSAWSDDHGVGLEHAVVVQPGAVTRMVHSMEGEYPATSVSADYCSVCEARGIDYASYHDRRH